MYYICPFPSCPMVISDLVISFTVDLGFTKYVQWRSILLCVNRFYTGQVLLDKCITSMLHLISFSVDYLLSISRIYPFLSMPGVLTCVQVIISSSRLLVIASFLPLLPSLIHCSHCSLSHVSKNSTSSYDMCAHSDKANSFLTPWAVALQAPLPMGLSRQE